MFLEWSNINFFSGANVTLMREDSTGAIDSGETSEGI